jgi:hypothetical protein
MKSFLLVFLSLCFAVGIVAAAQGLPNQAAEKHQAARMQSTSIIMGTVSEQGEKLRLVTDQRAWKVDNPETLRGHEGHYVHAVAYVYADENLIHIIEVRIPTARETREADIK